MNSSYNTFNFTTSPLHEFEIIDLVSSDLSLLDNTQLCLTDIGLYLVIAFILLMAFSTWLRGWGLDTRNEPNHRDGVPSDHYYLYLTRGSSGSKQYLSYTGVVLSHVEFKARSKPYDLVTDQRPYSATSNLTLYACFIATSSN